MGLILYIEMNITCAASKHFIGIKTKEKIDVSTFDCKANAMILDTFEINFATFAHKTLSDHHE